MTRRLIAEYPMMTAELIESGPVSDGTSGVKTAGRDVYFYEEVTQKSILELTMALRAADAATTADEIKYNVPIRLHINSPGGEVYAAMGFVDTIPLIQSAVHSIVSGFAASAATLMSVACDRRMILPNSFMLIHQITAYIGWGHLSDIQDEAAQIERMTETLVGLYASRTRLDIEAIREMLKRETYISASEAVSMGFVDEILTGSKWSGKR